MKNSGNWFQNLLQKTRTGMNRFMQGRYGLDRFNSVLLWISVAMAVIAMLLSGVVGLVLTLLA